MLWGVASLIPFDRTPHLVNRLNSTSAFSFKGPVLCSKAVEMEQGSKCTNTSFTAYWAPIHPSSSSLSPGGFTEGGGHPGHIASSHGTHSHLKLITISPSCRVHPPDNSLFSPKCMSGVHIDFNTLNFIINVLHVCAFHKYTQCSHKHVQMENNLYRNIMYVQKPCMGAKLKEMM